MAGAVIFGCAGPVLSAQEAAFFRDADPWGFILFDRNLENPAQIRALTASLRAAVGREAPILIDQEGGRVQRLWPPTWRQHPPALDLCEAAPDPVCAMYLRGRLIAAELAALGIDVNCAPNADIATADTHPRLRNRCYGTRAADVIRRARAMADGLLAGGVLPVVKHMPGHGSATKDSHLELPVVTKSRDALAAQDAAPFAALNDLPMAMTAHVVFTAYDEARPATTSPTLHRVMRGEIGFGGLLMTDDLAMEALTGTPAERAEAAQAAGCDIILHCNGALAEMETLAHLTLTQAAQTRAAAALARRAPATDVDIAALEADLSAMEGHAA
ncbi:MAG: beta-N-acetylhexosaminidase [Pseudomonadota bacterium]